MISIFDTDGKTRLAVAFNGISLNSITKSSAGARSTEYGYSTEVVAHRTAFDYVSEPNQWADMMEVYGIRKSSRIVVLRGWVRARNRSELHDKIVSLGAATDPSLIRFNNSTDPFLPLTFTMLTEDTTNFPTGKATSKYVGIPVRMVEPQLSASGSGMSALWELSLLLKEPKRFLQTAATLSGNGTITNIGTDRSFPTLTFTLSGGAGSASFTIQNVATKQGTVSLVLDLSGDTSGSWTVNFRDRTIYKDSTLRMDVYKSGDYFVIENGSNVISYTNTTNTSSRVLTYYPSYPL